MSRFTILTEAMPEARRTGVWRYTEEVVRRLVRIADIEVVPVSFEGPPGPGWSRYYARMLLKSYLVRPDGPVHSMCQSLVTPETEILTFYHWISYLRHDLSLPDRVMYRSFVRAIVAYPEAWVAISEPVRRQMIEGLRLPASHVHLAPPGVDATMFHPKTEARTRGDPKIILHVGIGYPRKGIDTLIEALGLLGASRYRLVRLGPVTDEAYMASCRRRAKELGLSLVELGRVSDLELVDWYNRAHLLVFPSQDEGAGMPPIEGMACGTNVVVSDLPAHRSFCGPFASYFHPRDSQDLARAIQEALASPSSRQELVAYARGFSWDATARVYADLYDSYGRG